MAATIMEAREFARLTDEELLATHYREGDLAARDELMDRFSYTQDRVAQEVGKSRPHIANTLRLLKLQESVKAMVTSGQARRSLQKAGPLLSLGNFSFLKFVFIRFGWGKRGAVPQRQTPCVCTKAGRDRRR